MCLYLCTPFLYSRDCTVIFVNVFFPILCCYSVGGGREYPVSIEPTVGEIIEAARVSESTLILIRCKVSLLAIQTVIIMFSVF